MAQTFGHSASRRQGGFAAIYSAAGSSSSLAGHSRSEFSSLYDAIGQNITAINSSSKQLEKLWKLTGKTKDLRTLQEQIHNINSETNERIESTSRDFKRLQVVLRNGDRQQRLQLERIKSDFQHVLEKYSAQQRRNSRASRQSYNAAVASQRKTASSVETELLQQQRQEQAELQREHNLLLERQRQVEQLEADVVDVNIIMKQLRRLISEQGDVVDKVEELVDESAVNVEEGRAELQISEVRRNSSRRRILILLFIAVIVVSITAGIIVWKYI
ncbi:hypothetical protein AWZ03_009097 [Drosophila navojoa]|uniref:t-SNARE coiled-coil homology domain-containing protein n=1 Tax=Drosophila navojoa TaxID=7232 RepID=A0A484B8U2_DRONA|nr:syntaxin-12-like [Drosophila navojoa]TDG44460.1 hypothetical protein AWZ03_009097 [Drosophila navojoa]